MSLPRSGRGPGRSPVTIHLSLGVHVKRSLIGIVIALGLTIMLVPPALAADGEPPAVEPTTTPAVEPTPTPIENGEIVIDPTFITTTPTPAGQVAGATGRPEPTPPSTDAITHATASGTSLQVLLVLGVAGSLLGLVAARLPVRRRR